MSRLDNNYTGMLYSQKNRKASRLKTRLNKSVYFHQLEILSTTSKNQNPPLVDSDPSIWFLYNHTTTQLTHSSSLFLLSPITYWISLTSDESNRSFVWSLCDVPAEGKPTPSPLFLFRSRAVRRSALSLRARQANNRATSD